ncbi:MAG: hypothetical protein KKF79_14325 [Gammaproteobacteria bacterium]|nr:hypothetical protein [Gammaproteobacteria bacterium]MBU2278049.1 hypothetical protein [Gammaproteobacteria bacterium]MBU2426634.1 hypothetical protein [Gammaproteobacteria bacterium]
MNNSMQLGFVSILLTLVMFFAFLSFQKDETGVEIDTIRKCQAMCCLTRCETHKVEVVDAQSVRFDGGLLSTDEFANHLLHAHQECEIRYVHMRAAPSIRHEIVLNITNRVLEVAPNTEIKWGNID